MSDLNNDWGWEDGIDEISTGQINAGIVNAKLLEMSYGPGNFGDQLTVKAKIEDTLTTTQWYSGNDDRGAEQAKKTKRAFQSIVIHFVGAYVGRESLREALQSATGLNSPAAFANFCIGLLPENYQEIEAQAIVHYGTQYNKKQSAYLGLPKSMSDTGAFWSVNGSSELEVNENNIYMTKKVTEAANTTEDDTEEDFDI